MTVPKLGHGKGACKGPLETTGSTQGQSFASRARLCLNHQQELTGQKRAYTTITLGVQSQQYISSAPVRLKATKYMENEVKYSTDHPHLELRIPCNEAGELEVAAVHHRVEHVLAVQGCEVHDHLHAGGVQHGPQRTHARGHQRLRLEVRLFKSPPHHANSAPPPLYGFLE